VAPSAAAHTDTEPTAEGPIGLSKQEEFYRDGKKKKKGMYDSVCQTAKVQENKRL